MLCFTPKGEGRAMFPSPLITLLERTWGGGGGIKKKKKKKKEKQEQKERRLTFRVKRSSDVKLKYF